MTKIVFLDRDSLIAELRRPNFPHAWQNFSSTLEHEVVDRLRGAQVAVSNKVPLSRESLQQLADLRFIAVAATGTNNVDLAYCRERGIPVSNIRGYAVHSVPEHVFAMMLSLRRNMMAYRDDLRCGAWQTAPTFCYLGAPIHDLCGSTLGIVGYGSIGQAVEKLARAFGMKCLIAEHKGRRACRPGYTSFSEVLVRADMITLHCPLTAETEGLITAAELRQMKPTALLINTARGGLVNETDLLTALREGWIAGAASDVLTTEPPVGGHPLLDYEAPNWLVTPHVAWASRQAMQRLADQLIDNVEAWQRGTPQNLVT